MRWWFQLHTTRVFLFENDILERIFSITLISLMKGCYKDHNNLSRTGTAISSYISESKLRIRVAKFICYMCAVFLTDVFGFVFVILTCVLYNCHILAVSFLFIYSYFYPIRYKYQFTTYYNQRFWQCILSIKKS